MRGVRGHDGVGAMVRYICLVVVSLFGSTVASGTLYGDVAKTLRTSVGDVQVGYDEFGDRDGPSAIPRAGGAVWHSRLPCEDASLFRRDAIGGAKHGQLPEVGYGDERFRCGMPQGLRRGRCFDRLLAGSIRGTDGGLGGCRSMRSRSGMEVCRMNLSIGWRACRGPRCACGRYESDR